MATLIGDKDRARTIVGYGWPWTVRPGESLNFMVSTVAEGGRYRADLVRLICAESLSKPSMFKEEELPSPFNGTYEGQQQRTHPGSYVEIKPTPALNALTSFTAQAMVMPTLLPAGARRRLGGHLLSLEDPEFHDQHLVSRWDNQKRRGWALIIDADGCPAFICGDGSSVHRTTLGRALTQDRWFFVAAVYDSERRAVTIHARPASSFVSHGVGWPETKIEGACEVSIVHDGPLRFAACNDGPGTGERLKPGLCFSGRLDRVRLLSGTLTLGQSVDLAARICPGTDANLVGFWDFGRGIESTEVHDLSTNRLNGVTVNLPLRAVTGVAWDGSATDWRQRPDLYSAIHFHDDDLFDAEWKRDFSFTVPQDLRSGIYAARLRHGESEDYIPFFVAPPRGQATARVAVLVPTASYTAYTNITTFTTCMKRRRYVQAGEGEPRIVEEDFAPAVLQDAAHAEFIVRNLGTLGKGIYANHTDGTLCSVASQKHPNMTIKPGGLQWTLASDTLLVRWLETAAIPYDIITDELLHKEGLSLLGLYRVVITGTHPEYYSSAMLDALGQYEDHGGRLMYLGGGGFYWVTSFSSQWPGAIEVRKDEFYSGASKQYEMHHAFDGSRGGLWEKRGRPSQSLVGVGCSFLTGCSFDGRAAYRRLPDSYGARAAFIFAGVDCETFGDYGVLGGGAGGLEFDSVDSELGTPSHALHLARTARFTPYIGMPDEEYALVAQAPYGDVVYFETSNGGAVFSAASMAWVGSLSHNNYDNDVARISANVLRRFMDQAPLAFSNALDGTVSA